MSSVLFAQPGEFRPPESEIASTNFYADRSYRSHFADCRRLMAQLNLLNHEIAAKIRPLTRSDQLPRELKHIDQKAAGRETHKIAVFYIAEGQEDKQSILQNAQGSTNFEKFVAALGWEVNLEQHSGYMGGLAQGPGTSVYYESPTVEVMFHVSTRISTDDMTKKLRHLGNDEVHIVWSEHWRPYRRSIIATEFCDVLLVIYPLPNHLFHIQIDAKPEVGDFGPLFDGALVEWPTLATLVRSTAVNAGRAKRWSIDGYVPHFVNRSRTLMEVAEKLSRPLSYRQRLVESVLNPDDPSHEETVDV